MVLALEHALLAEIYTGGQAYIRNLVAAEAAVLQGQFNVAKILTLSKKIPGSHSHSGIKYMTPNSASG
jgi:hypothetical protein